MLWPYNVRIAVPTPAYPLLYPFHYRPTFALGMQLMITRHSPRNVCYCDITFWVRSW